MNIPPRNMTLRGIVYEIRRPVDILINVTKMIIEDGKLRDSDIPLEVKRARTRYIINKKAVHKNGQPFLNPELLSKELCKELWLEGNYGYYSIDSAVYHSKQLLQRFGYPQYTLRVEDFC